MTDTKHTAAQPLDLDKLEALALKADGDDSWRYYTAFQEEFIPSTILALIAQARTTASASIVANVAATLVRAGHTREEAETLAAESCARATLAPVAAQQAAARTITQAGFVKPSAEEAACTCPSGDGSLRWPCPAHPPEPASTPEASQQNAEKPVARLHEEISDRPYTEGKPYFEITILDRARCFDGMELYAAPTAAPATTSEDARDAARYRWLTSGWTREELAADEANERQPASKPQLEVINQLALWYFAKDQIDALIDSAMRATQQEGGK